ncbi:hypothetical protein C8Q77DRAFT_9496 [Trametes polyzona]|nr:hypothetical protein C8Q77DRAFT_9496 [Trametes polyzona]
MWLQLVLLSSLWVHARSQIAAARLRVAWREGVFRICAVKFVRYSDMASCCLIVVAAKLYLIGCAHVYSPNRYINGPALTTSSLHAPINNKGHAHSNRYLERHEHSDPCAMFRAPYGLYWNGPLAVRPALLAFVVPIETHLATVSILGTLL